MTVVKLVLAVLVAALVQATLLSPVEVFGGTPDLVLVTLVAIALLHGSLAGAVVGFGAGLTLDLAYLAPLGVSSLLYMLVGFWAGRYGETTGRGRAHAPIVSVVVFTLVYAVASYSLHFVLGEDVSARRVFVEALLPTMGLNLVLGAPVVALMRRFVRPAESGDRAREVQLLG